jgi:hypothetical protein
MDRSFAKPRSNRKVRPKAVASANRPILGADVTLQSLPKRERDVGKHIPSRYY